MIDVRRVAAVVGLLGNVAFAAGAYHIVRVFGVAAFVGQFGDCDASDCGPDLANGAGLAGLVASVVAIAFAGSAAGSIALTGTLLVAAGVGVLAGASGIELARPATIAAGTVPLVLGLVALAVAAPAPSWRARLWRMPVFRMFLTETTVGEGWWSSVRPAAATVVDCAFTGQTVNDHTVYKVRVRLAPDGGDPVEVTRSVLVPDGVVLRAGDAMSAFYDPSDPQRFVLAPPAVG